METDGEWDVKALVDRPANKVSEIKAETLVYTIGHAYWTRWRTRFRKCRTKKLPTH